MTTSEKLDKVIEALVFVATKTGGPTAAYMRVGLERAGLVEFTDGENPDEVTARILDPK